MILRLALFALLSAAQIATAQTAPQYDRAQLAAGAAYSWEGSMGLSKAVNLGFDGQDYRFHITDRAPDGSEFETLYGTNRQGQLLWDLQDGETYTYVPNDCSFVLGGCTYTVQNETEVLGTVFSTASFYDGVWIHIENARYEGQDPYTNYICGIYDQDSIIQALYVIDSSYPDEPFWMRITSGPHAGQSREMLARVTAACQNAAQNQ